MLQHTTKCVANLSTGAELRSLVSWHEKRNPIALLLLLLGAKPWMWLPLGPSQLALFSFPPSQHLGGWYRLRAQTAAYNLNFALSGLFWLGAVSEALPSSALRQHNWRELRTSADPSNSHTCLWLGLDKKLFCRQNTPASYHLFLLLVTKARSVQKRCKWRSWTSQACQPGWIPYQSQKKNQRREMSLPVSMSSIEPNPLEVVCKEGAGREREKYHQKFIF